MSRTPSRYEKALSRNASEIQKALLIRTTLLGIEDLRYTAQIFIRIVNDSLRNDYISHAVKVFEKSSKSSSFWYIYRTDQRPIDRYANKVGYSITQLHAVTDKLKIIRNGTHFHIDSTGVLDPKAIWSDAGLTGKELSDAIDFAWGTLQFILQEKELPKVTLPNYTRESVLAVLKRIAPG